MGSPWYSLGSYLAFFDWMAIWCLPHQETIQWLSTELLESAKIDDLCGEIRTFWSVAFPIVKPGFAALAIFTFINTWNDYFMQLVMLTSRNNLTISLWCCDYAGWNGNQLWFYDYGGSCLAAIVIVTVFLVFKNPSLERVLLWERSKDNTAKIEFKLCQRHLAILKYCLQLASLVALQFSLSIISTEL